ncbi:MAG TPA: hemolysin family protein [Bacteroidota bacterium]|nr:hemolysin family protein [Bacteroidota bacterium]
MSVLENLVEFGGILCLILVNGFFVAAEFAIVKVRSTQIEPLLKGGNKHAQLAHHVITHLDTYLSATQLGITFTSLGLGWLGQPFVAERIVSFIAWSGIPASPLISTACAIVSFIAITFLLIVFGELGPRFLAIPNAARIALLFSGPLHLFYLVFRPFIRLLRGSATMLLRWIGITPIHEAEVAHSEEELRLLLGRGVQSSSLGRAISLNAFELRSRSIREIMVPRTRVVFLSTTDTLERSVATALDNQFTRYPLCEKDLDHVLGMVHLQELFRLKGETGSGDRLVSIKRDMLFVPETMNLERLLKVFLTKRRLMAIVVDEYGGTAGLITLENVLEELVGDIWDEFDTDQPEVKKVGEHEFVVDGSMSLHDFSRRFNIAPVPRDVVTVSGYVIQLLGKVPEKGAAFAFGDWSGVVESMDGKRVRALRLRARVPAGSLTGGG